MMSFNERIKERRIELGMTTDEVAKIVGVSNGTISRWETGTIRNQRRDKLERLAKALKTTPAELLGYDDSAYAQEPPAELSEEAEQIGLAFDAADETAKGIVRLALGRYIQEAPSSSRSQA